MIFTTLVSVCVGCTFYAQMRYVDHEVADAVMREAARLKGLHAAGPHQNFLDEVTLLRSRSFETEQLYVLASDGQPLSNSLAMAGPVGTVFTTWVDDDAIPGLAGEEAGYWPATIVEFDDGCRLLISIHSEVNETLRRQLLPGFVTLDILLVVLMTLLGASIGRALLVRVDALNDTARAVTAGELSRRAPIDGSGDEFDELGSHFNTMLTKTEKLIVGMRRVSDNVAHDLRRPLSRIRSGLEITLLESRTPEQYRQAIDSAILEVDNVIATFNSLLQIARVESGAGPRERKRVDLGALVGELADLYQDIGEPIEFRAEPNVIVRGDPHLLRQALSNLLENALKFSPGHGVSISAYRSGGRSVVSVADRGPGIPHDQREFVLERFSRLEEARSTPGNGLGLAMVKAAADLHQAELSLADNEPGLRVTLTF